MTNKEALKAWEEFYNDIDKEEWLFVGTINPEMVSLAIKALEERPQGEWIDYDNTFYKCPECGYLLEKCCPQCQNKVILPKGGAK